MTSISALNHEAKPSHVCLLCSAHHSAKRVYSVPNQDTERLSCHHDNEVVALKMEGS